MIVFYRISTGEILNTVSDGDPTDKFDPPGLPTDWGALTSVVNEPDPDTQYVVGTAIVARDVSQCSLDKINSTANGTDKATISNIPNPSIARIKDDNGEFDIEVDDGILEITAETAQTITVCISSFPQLDFEVEVIAT